MTTDPKKFDKSKFKKYKYLPFVTTGAFVLIAFIASFNGFTSPATDLEFLSENRLLASLLFIGFIIAINERLIETVVATLRQGDKEDIEREIKVLKEAGGKSNIDELKSRKFDLIYYRAESRRLTLSFSVFFGCTLACLGIVNVFGALLDPTELVSSFHIALIDTTDVLVAGWLVAGGSKGWNQLTSTIEAQLIKNKVVNKGL